MTDTTNKPEMTELEKAQLEDLKAKARYRKTITWIVAGIAVLLLFVFVVQPIREQARINAYNNIMETLGEE